MFNVFYSKETGKIVHISQSKASSEALIARWKERYEFHQTHKDTAIAQKLMTGQLNWKEYIVKNNYLIKIKRPKNPTRPGKYAARQTLQKIEKEFLFEGFEVHMALLYNKTDHILSIHFGDNIEFSPNHQLYIFFTLEDDPTILKGQIEFPITNETHIFTDVPDLTKCGIYTIRHFTNINYKELE